MKKFFKILSFSLILCILFTTVACSNRGDGNKDDSYVLEINSTELNTLIGDTNYLFVTNEGVQPEDVTWTSSDSLVASVDETGMVESQSVGTAKIKATCGKYSKECTVVVSLGNKLPQLVIENERKSYRIGKSEGAFPFSTYVLYNGKKFYDADVTCVSSDTTVATFSAEEQGKLQILDKGNTSLTFSAVWRGLSEQNVPSLFKTIDVTIIEEVYFYINDSQYQSLNLCTVAEFNGETYVNSMDFVPSISLEGVESKNVTCELPENLLVKEGNKIRAIGHGTGEIILSFIDATNKEYQTSIPVNVTRPEATYEKHLQYFSTFTGTFKDVDDDYKDKTLAEELFGTSETQISAYYDGEELSVTSDGKVQGMPDDYRGTYDATIRVETVQVRTIKPVLTHRISFWWLVISMLLL